MSKEKTLIIGGGQAACQTATSLKSKKYDGEIKIFCSENYLPYQRPPLSKKFLLGELDKERLFFKPEKFYTENEISINLNSYVQRIDIENKEIFLENNKKENYDNLVIATGTIPRKIDINKKISDKVFYLRSIEDVLNIRDKIKESKKVTIIGGGYIGLEVAAIINNLGLQVTIVEMASRILERVTSETISSFYTKLHRQAGVEVLTNTSVEGLSENNNGIEVATSDGGIISDFVIVGIGVLPCDTIASESGIEVENGIIVDEFCKTSNDSVFSAGDCTMHPNIFYNKNIRLESVHNAIEQGKTVAASIIGEKTSYNQVPWFWSDQYETKLQIVGLLDNYDDIVVRGDTEKQSFAVFYLKDNRIIASDCVNRPSEHMMSRKLISEKVLIDEDRLLDETIPIKEIVN
ncbi:MAG: pyridine nucleotide-disulfide oxidoreductase [Rhodobiaceae bacterium]|nr:pyridine nucleotide-disulfide oxidoreductase [Rhodobiaceae bacterium]|tara:strand:+ start:13 stop:1230 length:1218 start_codon:yes stop_codon:yes gene_type:complete